MILKLGIAAINLDYVTDVKHYPNNDDSHYFVFLVHGNYYKILDSIMLFDDFVKKLEENKDAM